MNAVAERIDLARLDDSGCAALVARLRAARLVCFPTDTVYGVGGACTAEVAAALVNAKGRDLGKPLQVVFPSVALLETLVPMASPLLAACRALLPGPLTLVIPYPPGWTIPTPAATLGVRVPAWPPPAQCLSRLDFPLLASSANPSGGVAPASLDAVDATLLATCEVALDAGPVSGVASTVLDLSEFADTGAWRVLRAGAAAEGAIAAELAAVASTEDLGATP